jgi:hypothetical protein
VPTYTPNFNLAKPLVNSPVDEDLWGGELNDDMDIIDTTMKSIQDSAIEFTTTEESLAAAATTDIGSTTSGNVYVTGTGVTITSFGTAASGVYRKLRFAGANTLDYDATALILPGTANITTALNDELEAFSLGGGNWVVRWYTKANGEAINGSKFISYAYTVVGTANSGTNPIPRDNSIPQISEGDEYMTLVYTPTSAASILKVDVALFVSNNTNADLTGALFRDAGANAIACGHLNAGDPNLNPMSFTAYVTAGSTSATTFRVRAGASGGLTTFNGEFGSGLFGGALASSITVTELRA